MYNLFFCTDHNNLVPLLTLINSIQKNTRKRKKINLNILVDCDPDWYNYQLNYYFKNVFKSINIQEFSKNSNEYDFLNKNIITTGDRKFSHIWSIMNFSRIYLPNIFNVNYGLYMDTDMIVQYDITKIFNYLVDDLSNFKIAGVMDKDISELSFKDDINLKGKSLQTGLYLFNLNYWRENNITKLCENLILKHREGKLCKTYRVGTQVIINYVYYNKVKEIDYKWNYSGLGIREFKENSQRLNDAYVLHWSGEKKPWLDFGLNKTYWLKYKLNIQKFSIKFVDKQFAPNKSKSKYDIPLQIKWNFIDSEDINENDVVFYSDQTLKDSQKKTAKYKIAWILEPTKIHIYPYKYIEENIDNFDLIITSMMNYVKKYPDKFVYAPNIMSWIKPNDRVIYPKTKKCSLVFSDKKYTKNHKIRHQIIDYIKEKNLDIDMYGKAVNNHTENKKDAMSEYCYHVVVENCGENGYYSEKIIDCFLTGCIPIFFGKENHIITKVFNPKGIFFFQKIHKLESIINSLNMRTYLKKKRWVEENFEIACKMTIPEDYIFTNCLTKNIKKQIIASKNN